MPSDKKHTLSRQLVQRVILPLLASVIFISGFQAYLYYQSSITAAQTQLEQHINLVRPMLSRAVYDADTEGIHLIGDSLFQNPYVDYLVISDQFSQIYLRSRKTGIQLERPPVVISSPISYTNDQGQHLLLGNFKIHFNHEAPLIKQAGFGIAVTLLEALKLLMPLLALMLFLNRKLLRRLNDLIRTLSESRTDQLHQIPVMKDDPKEIEALIHGYNQLRENNFRFHHRQLEAHAQLIERTQEVAEERESARLLTHMLQNSQKRYRALFHRNLDALLIVESFRLEDKERYRIIDANQAAIKILRYPLEQLIKQDFEVIFGGPPLEQGSLKRDKQTLSLPQSSTDLQIELYFNVVRYEKQRLYYVTLREIRV